MAYTLSVSLALGSGAEGSSLLARLVDSAGVVVTDNIVTGFHPLGGGLWLWTYDAIPGGFRGAVVFLDATGQSLAVAAINPEEAERIDAYVSSRTPAGMTLAVGGQWRRYLADEYDYGWGTADSYPIQWYLADDTGAALSVLPDTPVRFRMWNERTKEPVVDAAAVWADVPTALAEYTPSPANTATAGTFNADWLVTLPGGDVITVPAVGYIRIRIKGNGTP